MNDTAASNCIIKIKETSPPSSVEAATAEAADAAAAAELYQGLCDYD